MADLFAPIHGLTVYYVDSVSGTGKTYSMVAAAIDRAAKLGTKTLFAMPTLKLIREFVEFARRNTSGVPIIEITSREDDKKPANSRPPRCSLCICVAAT